MWRSVRSLLKKQNLISTTTHLFVRPTCISSYQNFTNQNNDTNSFASVFAFVGIASIFAGTKSTCHAMESEKGPDSFNTTSFDTFTASSSSFSSGAPSFADTPPSVFKTPGLSTPATLSSLSATYSGITENHVIKFNHLSSPANITWLRDREEKINKLLEVPLQQFYKFEKVRSSYSSIFTHDMFFVTFFSHICY